MAYPVVPTFNNEIQMQAFCCTWFWNEFPVLRRLLHTNNNNSVNRIEGAANKSMGVVRGVSDCEFVDYGVVWFLEFKMPGKKQEPEQIDFMIKVQDRGQRYLILYSFEDFYKFIAKRVATYE